MKDDVKYFSLDELRDVKHYSTNLQNQHIGAVIFIFEE